MNWNEVMGRFSEANFLQSPEYGKMNELLGAKVVQTDFGGQGWALMIVRNAKRGRYLEIPCGPLIDWGDVNLREKVMQEIHEVAVREKCVFVRMRPQLMCTPENLRILKDLRMKKSPMHLAAEHTVMIDLTCSETDMLTRMRRQTRYEVRRAEKMGMAVERSNTEEIFREFHAVQVETAKRQGFIPPSLEVLLAEREAFGGRAWIYVAYAEGGARGEADRGVDRGDDGGVDRGETTNGDGGETSERQPVAYGLIIGDGREADYYEAASTDLNRKLPGAYALLWRAMRDLKVEGYERFNLWGIAPAGQPHHRYAGVTTFKTGFGGEVVEYVPAHDLVVSRVRYLSNLAVEEVRKKRRHL